MSSKSNISTPIVEPEVPDVEPEVPVTRAEALVAEATMPEPEPEPEQDYAAYLAAEAARRTAWIHG